MFEKAYEMRVKEWRDFRAFLEYATNPVQLAIDKYKGAPAVDIQTDPWDKETWPEPWELILENQYCDFCKLLGIFYSLQLTDRFSDIAFEIHIAIDKEKEKTYYLLFAEDLVIGYDDALCVHKTKLPSSLESQMVYDMKHLN